MKLSRDKTADFKHFSTQLCNWGDTKGRLHCEEKRREKEQWAPRVVRKLKSMEKQKAQRKQRTASGPRSSVGASSKVVCSTLSSLGGDTFDLQWNQDDVNSLHWSTMSNEISSEVSQQRRDHDRAIPLQTKKIFYNLKDSGSNKALCCINTLWYSTKQSHQNNCRHHNRNCQDQEGMGWCISSTEKKIKKSLPTLIFVSRKGIHQKPWNKKDILRIKQSLRDH